jgi:hypothetical protein
LETLSGASEISSKPLEDASEALEDASEGLETLSRQFAEHSKPSYNPVRTQN